MKEKGLAMELLADMKKANKRMFIIWVITFIGLLLSISYTIWLLNDIQHTEEIIDIEDVENIENSDIQLGDR